MKQYFFLQNNQQIGPLSLEVLLAHNLNADTMIWYDGLPNWMPISNLPEYKARHGQVINAAAAYKQPATDYSNPNYYDPNNPYAAEPIKDWTIHLIILLVVSLCTCVGVILPAIGLIMAHQSKKSLQIGNRFGAEKNARSAGILFKVGLAITLILFSINLFKAINNYNKTGSFNPYNSSRYYNSDDDDFEELFD